MYTAANTQNAYYENMVMTASPVDLLVLLQEAAIKNLNIAKYNMEKKKFEQTNIALLKAQNILVELMNSLDLKYDSAKSMLQLYDFMNEEIVQANIDKTPERLDPVIKMLDELRQAWRTSRATNLGSNAVGLDVV